MNHDDNADDPSNGESRQKSAERTTSKLGDIVPEELAHQTVEAVLQQLDRLAISLFPKTRMSPLRDLASRDQKFRGRWTFHSSLGCAVANVARYAQAGIASHGSLLDEMNCILGAAYTRAADGAWTPAIDTLGRAPLDIVLRAALARHRVSVGEAISVPDLVALSGGDDSALRRELITPAARTVSADVAHSWLAMLGVDGLRK